MITCTTITVGDCFVSLRQHTDPLSSPTSYQPRTTSSARGGSASITRVRLRLRARVILGRVGTNIERKGEPGEDRDQPCDPLSSPMSCQPRTTFGARGGSAPSTRVRPR